MHSTLRAWKPQVATWKWVLCHWTLWEGTKPSLCTSGLAFTCLRDPCTLVHVPTCLCSGSVYTEATQCPNLKVWHFHCIRRSNPTVEGGVYFLLKMGWTQRQHTPNMRVLARGTVSYLQQINELNATQFFHLWVCVITHLSIYCTILPRM